MYLSDLPKIMLQKMFNLLLAHRIWAYLATTAIAALAWGFAEGLISFGLTWAALTIARNFSFSNDAFAETYARIDHQTAMQGKGHNFPVGTTHVYSTFDDEPANPAEQVQKDLDEQMYDPSYHDLPGNAWHR
ncbi:MAG: hypothetical protein V4568_01825 [Pseudomonadota bacterium]